VKRAAAGLLLACACACAAPGAWAASDAEVAAFLERAQFWQARNREDLARDEVEKALRVAPDNADALVMQARMQLRANRDKDAAETLERLRRAHPQHPTVAQLSAALRIRGPDREKLRQARQLVRAGRNDEAVRAYAAIFPDGFPDDDMALEQAQVVAGTRNGWEPARALLADLAKRHPEDARYQVALAAHVASRKPVPPQVIATLRDLAKHPSSAVSRPAAEAWRRAMRSLDAVEESLPALREYVAANPDDSAVSERLEEVARIVEAQRRQLADPGLRAKREGWAALDANRTDEAEARLQEALAHYPRDPEAVGGLGLVRLRQGRHEEARALFDRAAALEPKARDKWEGLARTSRFWGLLAQARAAREAERFDAAEALAREARSLDPKEEARQKSEERKKQLAEARAAVQEGERTLRDARKAAADAEAALKKAAAQAKETERVKLDLEKKFEKVAADADAARQHARRIASEAEEAAQAVDEAERALAKPQAEIDRLG